MSHERYIRIIDDLIVREVEAGEWNELHRHLADCTSCRARYDRVSLADLVPRALQRLEGQAAETLKILVKPNG